MTEVPEHLLARARLAREKASSMMLAHSESFGNQYHNDEPPEEPKSKMQTFKVLRRGDESGVSGTGVVVEGVVFSGGKCVINWVTKGHPGSVTFFDSFEHFKEIHIDSHPGNKTMIIWSDGHTWRQDDN